MKTVQVQLTLSLDEAAASALAELLFPVIRQALAAVADVDEEKRKARLRTSQNAIFAGAKPPEDQGLLIDSKEAAKLLKVSPRTLWAMRTTGRMPAPVRIGRAIRWSREVLKQWVEAGAPSCRPVEPPRT